MKVINFIHLSLLAKAAADPSLGCSLSQTSGSWTNKVEFNGGLYEHAYTDSASENNAAADPSPGCSLSQTSGSWTNKVEFNGGLYEHAYTYPDSASENHPAPLILFFHGWGGSSSDCGNSCSLATERGYATIALTGIGSEYGDLNSWNGFGSTQSGTGAASDEALVPGDKYCGDASENDRICNVDAYELGCYSDCKSTCADECWWTTCQDSVQQTVEVLEEFINSHCVDMNRIYAVGWSNGGMFTYELANDERSAKYLAAISPQIGLPHFGYNHGPHPDYKIHHIGLWGQSDTTVPPVESPSSQGCSVPCRTSEPNGWFYTSSECVMNKWASDLELTSDGSIVDSYGIPEYKDILQCSEFTAQESGAVVLGCIFDGGHDTGDYHDEVTLNFFDAHSKVKSSSSSATMIPTDMPKTVEPTPSPSDKSTTTNPSMAASISPTQYPSIYVGMSDNLSTSPSTIVGPSLSPTAEQSSVPSGMSSEGVVSGSPVPTQSAQQPSFFASLEPSTSSNVPSKRVVSRSPLPTESAQQPTSEPSAQLLFQTLSPSIILKDEQITNQYQAPVLSILNASNTQLPTTSAPTSSGVVLSPFIAFLLSTVGVMINN